MDWPNKYHKLDVITTKTRKTKRHACLLYISCPPPPPPPTYETSRQREIDRRPGLPDTIITITVTSHVSHGVLNHRKLCCFRQFALGNGYGKIKAPHYYERNSLITSGFPSQRASNEESVPISWRHYRPILQFCKKHVYSQYICNRCDIGWTIYHSINPSDYLFR